MLYTKRKFHRFDSDTIVEFRQLKKTNKYSVGITRNFSSAGFRFESENYDSEPEEDLEFKLKHPHRDLFVSVNGKAVWKEKSEFGCVTGIELKDLDKTTRKMMLEIASVSGNIPDDSFHYGKDKESVVTEKEDIKSEEKSSFSENNNNFNKRKLNWLFGVLVIVALMGIGYTALAVFKNTKLEQSLEMQEKQLLDIRGKLIKLMENNVSLNESVGNLYPMQQSGTLDTERREEFLVKIEQIEQQLKHGLSNITKFEQDLAHKFEAYTKQQGDILFGASISSNVKAETKKKQVSSTPKEVPDESKKLLSENEKLNDENKRLKNELQRVYRFL